MQSNLCCHRIGLSSSGEGHTTAVSQHLAFSYESRPRPSCGPRLVIQSLGSQTGRRCQSDYARCVVPVRSSSLQFVGGSRRFWAASMDASASSELIDVFSNVAEQISKLINNRPRPFESSYKACSRSKLFLLKMCEAPDLHETCICSRLLLPSDRE